ncbi:MAG: hypothetical protein M3167_08170 [Acidobacteriota bacterium]|nr:hypothetical protein [Acidobacteriota bacterium]
MIWPLTLAVFLVLGILAFQGARWAYFTFLGLGLLFFPARVGFRFHPQPCESALNVPLALFSLTNYGHIVLWAIFFVMTTVQLRRYAPRTQFLISAGAALAFGIYVELAEGITGKGHCRLRDLVPDAAGAALGAILVLALPKRRKAFK